MIKEAIASTFPAQVVKNREARFVGHSRPRARTKCHRERY
jgi:hypothetical protein